MAFAYPGRRQVIVTRLIRLVLEYIEGTSGKARGDKFDRKRLTKVHHPVQGKGKSRLPDADDAAEEEETR